MSTGLHGDATGRRFVTRHVVHAGCVPSPGRDVCVDDRRGVLRVEVGRDPVPGHTARRVVDRRLSIRPGLHTADVVKLLQQRRSPSAQTSVLELQLRVVELRNGEAGHAGITDQAARSSVRVVGVGTHAPRSSRPCWDSRESERHRDVSAVSFDVRTLSSSRKCRVYSAGSDAIVSIICCSNKPNKFR